LLREATNFGQGAPQDAWAGEPSVWPPWLGLQLPAGVSGRTRVGRATLPSPLSLTAPYLSALLTDVVDFPKTTLQRPALTCSLLLIQLSRLFNPPILPQAASSLFACDSNDKLVSFSL